MLYEAILDAVLFELKFGFWASALLALSAYNLPVARRWIAVRIPASRFAKQRAALFDDSRWQFFGKVYDVIASAIPLR